MKISTRKRGVALVLSLLLLPLIAMLAFTLTTMSVSNLNISRNRENSKQAAYVAESGTEEALQRLKLNTDFKTEVGGSSTPFTRAVTNGNVTETATVRVWNNRTGSAVFTVPVNGAKVPIGYAYVLSTATGPDSKVKRSAGLLAKLQGSAPSPWNYGAVGYDLITLKGTKTLVSSYSSAGGGTWAATKVGWDDATTTVGGHIASGTAPDVASTAGDIDFNSNNKVAGRVDILQGGDPGGEGDAASRYKGSSVVTTPVANTPVEIPAQNSQVALSSAGANLTAGKYYTGLMSSAVNLTTPGDYVFDDLVGSRLKVTAGVKVNIYVTGKNGGGIDLAGLNVVASGLNGNQNPDFIPSPTSPAKNVTVYAGPLITTINMRGNGSYACCRLYAPHAEINLGSAKAYLFGSVAGKTVKLHGNMDLMYDRDSAEPNIPPDAITRYRQRF